MKNPDPNPEDEAFEELALKQGHWQHTSGWRKKQIQVAQPEHEPVAWMWDVNIGGGYTTRDVGLYQTSIPFAKHTPLYTHPPQRKPLTYEQIFACENSVPDEVVSDRDWCIHFARAIEAAHGIKENT